MKMPQKSVTGTDLPRTKLNPYLSSAEKQMISFYNLLSEKDKRLYAAAEAIKLPYGGITYISTLFGCDRKTIRRGIVELNNPELIETDRERKKGGGRKLSIRNIPNINEAFLAVIYDYTAGDPMDEKIRWTHLTHQQIADKLKEEGIEVSRKIVKQLFKKHGYVKRAAQKAISIGAYKFRDEQFAIINKLRAEYYIAGNPIISIDTKKKELLGNLYRYGKLYTLEVLKVFDHDFPHLAEGIMCLFGRAA